MIFVDRLYVGKPPVHFFIFHAEPAKLNSCAFSTLTSLHTALHQLSLFQSDQQYSQLEQQVNLQRTRPKNDSMITLLMKLRY